MVRRGVEAPGRTAGRTTGTSTSLARESCATAWSAFPTSKSILAARSHDVGEIDARYVVGCDGARSWSPRHRRRRRSRPARALAGGRRLSSRRPVTALPRLTVQLCDPARPATVVRGVGDRRRWEITLLPGEVPARMTEPEFLAADGALARRPTTRARTRRRLHLPLGGGRSAGATAGCCSPATPAPTPPFLGQGMCAGIAMRPTSPGSSRVCVGEAPPTRCSTATRRARAACAGLHRAGGEARRSAAGDRPGAAAERDARFSRAHEMFDFPQPQLGPGCRDDAPPPVGTIFRSRCLPDGRSIDEAIGRASRSSANRLSWRLKTDAVPLPGVGLDWLARHGAGAAILRPDRYVFALSRSPAGTAGGRGRRASRIIGSGLNRATRRSLGLG